MQTQCNPEQLYFQDLGPRKVVGSFDGGTITSDTGALLLMEVDRANNFFGEFSSCFTSYRDQRFVEHSVTELVAQRSIGLCLGYEDLNDHDELRRDPVLATICGKLDPTGSKRRNERDRGIPLAGKSTLKTANLDPGNESLPDVQWLVERIRARWPNVRIILRGDSGFCRDDLLSWCEENEVLYLFGMAKNSRLLKRITREMKKARRRFYEKRPSLRICKDIADRTSSATMRANQLRMYFFALAYVFLSELRRRALPGTQFVKAQCHTIRLKLLKIGAQVRVSVRRVIVSFAEFP